MTWTTAAGCRRSYLTQNCTILCARHATNGIIE